MAHLSDRQKAELVRQHLDGVPWTRIAEHSGVTVRALQRWADRIEAGQLARPPRRDKGASRTPTELVTAIVAGLLDGAVHHGSEFDLGIAQSTLSHHVKILREAGLVQNDPEGTRCLLSLRSREVDGRFPGLIDQLRSLLQADAHRREAA